MTTQAEIRNQVLNKLRVVKVGQTGPTTITDVVDLKLDQWHALYSEKNAVYWAEADDVPAEAANCVVDILVDECSTLFIHEYPLTQNERIEIAARRMQADKDLRLLNNVDYQPSPTKFEDF